jgi:hypothetical protein
MSRFLLRYRFLWILPVLVVPCSGCFPRVVWLPDSSGFLYTVLKEKETIFVRYDVTKGERRVVLVDPRNETVLPALSPDGKRFAAFRLYGKTKVRKGVVQPGEDMVQVVVYGLDGKELHRSPELLWRKNGRYNDTNLKTGGGELFWAPPPHQDKLILVEHLGSPGSKAGDTAIFDLAADKLAVVLPDKVTGFAPVDPDGRGFVVEDRGSASRMEFVDWSGKSQKISVTQRPLQNWQPESAPWLGSWRWQGHVLVGLFQDNRTQVDTDKLTATIELNPGSGRRLPPRYIDAQYAFLGGQTKVRVFQNEEWNGKPFRSLEIVRGGERPKQLVGKADWISFSPAPNDKLLAIRIVNLDRDKPDEILVLNTEGQIVRRIVERKEDPLATVIANIERDLPLKAPNAKDICVVATAGSLSLNGQKLELPVDLQVLTKVLGKPTRRTDTIWTWDELGIFVYLDINKQASELCLMYQRRPLNFAPKRMFRGKLKIDDIEITSETTVESINGTRKGKPFDRVVKSIPNWWEAVQGNRHIFLWTLENGGKGIAEVAISRRRD